QASAKRSPLLGQHPRRARGELSELDALPEEGCAEALRGREVLREGLHRNRGDGSAAGAERHLAGVALARVVELEQDAAAAADLLLADVARLAGAGHPPLGAG